MGFEELLTVGAINQILDNHNPANPVLQIIGFKAMNPDQMELLSNPIEELRYRLMIGDGVKAHQYCVISNQDLVEDIRTGRLDKWAIVRLTNYQTHDTNNGPPENRKRLIYILNLDIVKKGSEINQKIVVPENSSHQQSHFNLNRNNSNFISPQPDIVNRPPPIDRPSNTFRNSFESTQPQPYPVGGVQRELIKSPQSMRNSHDSQIIGIGELTPYVGRWVVKGRVTAKGGIREYSNAKGSGKLFNFTMADKTGEIKITAFNTDCERVYGYVEPNKVYILGRASVKNADKRYTTADFEVTLNNDSLLEEVVDASQTSEVPMARFNFVSIASLTNIPPNQPVDLIGAIEYLGEMSTVISRTKNKELKKREVTIVDMSRHSISVTIWDEPAVTFTGKQGDVFVTKAARIGTFGGRSGSAGDCIFINPEIPEVRKIKNWYANLMERNFTALTTGVGEQGGGDQWKTLSQMLDLEQAKLISSSGSPSGSYGKCKALLVGIGKNPVYKCCPTEKCGKKLIDTVSGELKCEKCQQTFSSYKYRYKTDVEIEDHSGSSWVTLWDEKAEMLLSMKPEELQRYMKMDNKDVYERILMKPTFTQFIFTLRARIDTYNQEERVKLNVISMTPLDPSVYSKRLVNEIKSFTAESVNS